MVLIPHDTCSAETEIKLNIRNVWVDLTLINISAIETGM